MFPDEEGQWDEEVCGEARSFIRWMLLPDSQRPRDFEEIRRHPWFEGIGMDSMDYGDATG